MTKLSEMISAVDMPNGITYIGRIFLGSVKTNLENYCIVPTLESTRRSFEYGEHTEKIPEFFAEVYLAHENGGNLNKGPIEINLEHVIASYPNILIMKKEK